jgi:hypothetical protein
VDSGARDASEQHVASVAGPHHEPMPPEFADGVHVAGQHADAVDVMPAWTFVRARIDEASAASTDGAQVD